MTSKLNVGSGQRPFGEGWTNIDSQAKWNPDVQCDFGGSDPDTARLFKPDSADIIVLHHVLEHYGCNEGHDMLQECHRILSPTGSLLVFVPDMFELASMWREFKISDQIYMTNLYGAYMGDEADRHKWGYTFSSLRGELYRAGFNQVRRFDWRDIKEANLARDRWILALEATK